MTEISDNLISTISKENEESYSKLEVALIEFGNGKIELFTVPVQNIVFNPNADSNQELPSQKAPEEKTNFVSLNTLALFNADVSVFYEHLFKNKKIGVGVMGAYNFNLKTTFPNLFLSLIHNAKKKFDLGATLSIYPVKNFNQTSIYLGLMVKYTSFSFDKSITNSNTATANTISYSRTEGYQLATMITGGTQTFLNEVFYVRTLVGLGAFKLNGDFKNEFNLVNGKQVRNGKQNSNVDFLPKIYLGLNIGINF